MKNIRFLFYFLFLLATCLLQAQLIHRYTFDDNVDDSVGNIDGDILTNADHLESPGYISELPDVLGPSAPDTAIDFNGAAESEDSTQTNLFTIDGNVMDNSQTMTCWFNADTRNVEGVD
tara:strand:- start:75 stop:431 length:357 start_codon:yes stop_codon:yes gene_type:complete